MVNIEGGWDNQEDEEKVLNGFDTWEHFRTYQEEFQCNKGS